MVKYHVPIISSIAQNPKLLQQKKEDCGTGILPVAASQANSTNPQIQTSDRLC
ncbi:MAG: hypothetical protein F6K47_13040 [Symploca sp. SIO2E6]|nr:hypothetical protein [Symploca sp. SIO2E6]